MSSDSKSFSSLFSSTNPSTSSPFLPDNNGGWFSFSVGKNNCDTTERRRKVYPTKFKATTPEPSKRKTSSLFGQCPLNFEKTKEKENSNKTTHEKWVPENDAKTTIPVLSSAVPETIPCSFEGSSYSYCFQPHSFANEESVKKESDETSVQIGSQIIPSYLLKNIPQSPHFWPLRSYSNTAKQTLINAWNQIFEETVDQIRNVQITCFRSEAKRLWETTQELQMMGYNVIPLRRRLVELTDVKLRKNKHKSEKMRLKSKAERHLMEKNKLEFEILTLKAKVEAEKASFEDVMANVAKMEDETSRFDDLFSKLAIEPL